MSTDRELPKLSDEQLFRLLKNGNTEAFDELYRRYSRRLLHYLLRMLNGNESRAQDLLQDVFLRTLDKKDRFRDANKFSTWIFTIAHNLCKNEYRSLHSRLEVDLPEGDYLNMSMDNYSKSGMDNIDYEKFKSRLLNLLKSLPGEQRSTFLLRFQENLSIPEIAEVMDCPVGTVKSRLHYTLHIIAERLKVFNPNTFEVL